MARGVPPAGLSVPLQVEHDFILQAERETFIEQMKDVMDKAEDMLSEDTDIDRGSDPGTSPPYLSTCTLGAREVCPGGGVLGGLGHVATWGPQVQGEGQGGGAPSA